MNMRANYYIVISLLLMSITAFPAGGQSSSESIGFYTAGCIQNSQKLEETGLGYQVIRLSRERYYGHPSLIEFIKYIGKHTKAKLNSTLLIGDMSSQTGGPLHSDHNSHQTGLDADIMYLNQNNGNSVLSVSEREDINPVSVLTDDKKHIDKDMWGNKYTALLVLASAHPDVERIFVNPVIKKELCDNHAGQDWLNKIRPWYDHDGHFHVRLKCPKGSLICENQKSVKTGDGCGEDLEQWFSRPAKSDEDNKKSKPEAKKVRQMPEICKDILSR